MLSSLYSSLTSLSWPLLKGLGSIRVQKGKEIKSRLSERYGISKIKRPDGNLIWIHAASNGEALSALPLIDYFQNLDHPPHILITTMTVTSAQLIQKRTVPDHVTHQFIPYDHPKWIEKFHDHWHPDMVIWIESELWPNHLKAIKDKNIPSMLLNARLSDKSVKRWAIARLWFQNMLSCFDTILAQTHRDADNLKSLGIETVETRGNLKDLSPALPFDIHAADDIRAVIESRPCLLFASTHDPEEGIALEIHQRLKTDFPNLLSIIVPRHPKRGESIANELSKSGLNIARRSLKMSRRMDTDIYVADTIGELGLFYHLCPIVFVGNSMGTKPGGGHNLLEPAWHQCAIVSGDDLHNFSIQASEMPKQNACLIVNNNDELYNKFKILLNDYNLKLELSNNAQTYAINKYNDGMESIIEAIKPTCQKAGIV